ncbi:VOC family protein [Bosea sp. ASV33]|uniref:VOC family protein n=1 Tax=Bosea sp. ASV33 TaxID=2795106 RepID=UPI0018EB1ADA|nr:VOC family protein [Bosea sp. ASV33]
MFSHVCVGTNEFERAEAFYGALCDALGLKLRFSDRKAAAAAWQPAGSDRPLLFLTRPFDGQAATQGNGHMVAFLAENRATVDRSHEIALAHGGSCEGPPGLRPHYHANYYGAYFRDPDGNKVCVCCHREE